MKYDENGQPIKAIDTDPIKGVRPRRQAFGYDVEHSLDSMHFLKELIDILNGLGWQLHDVVAEGAYSQFELDLVLLLYIITPLSVGIRCSPL